MKTKQQIMTKYGCDEETATMIIKGRKSDVQHAEYRKSYDHIANDGLKKEDCQ